ncbi:MAG: response regulator transcription factor [Sulfurospirillum sp.]
MSYKILILEDNELLLETLDEFLSDNGYRVRLAKNGNEALSFTYNEDFDLFLLDVKVPDINGFEFLKQMRNIGCKTPAIFLTSLRDKESLAEGFGQGADDYIKKPFDLDEVLFRIKAVLSRKVNDEDEIKIFGGFYINKERKRVFDSGIELDLNLKDYKLLCLLIENRGKVVTTEMIVERLWKNEVANIGSIRVYITNLKKIFGKDSIINIRGIGYRFEK